MITNSPVSVLPLHKYCSYYIFNFTDNTKNVFYLRYRCCRDDLGITVSQQIPCTMVFSILSHAACTEKKYPCFPVIPFKNEMAMELLEKGRVRFWTQVEKCTSACQVDYVFNDVIITQGKVGLILL